MFVKNDTGFVCKNCGEKVEKLNYTSRDHCPYCLYSLHVDITPGDRQNPCCGLLKPINVVANKSKQQIEYVCVKCGEKHRNIVAEDDDKDQIYKVIENYSKYGGV